MTTIQEIRDALKEYDEAETELIKNKGEDIKVRSNRMYRVQVARIAIHRGSIDYIRTLLAEIDKMTIATGELCKFFNNSNEDFKRIVEGRAVKLMPYIERAEKAEQERDALRAEVERLNQDVNLRAINMVSNMAEKWSASAAEAIDHKSNRESMSQAGFAGIIYSEISEWLELVKGNSSGVDPLLNKPGATEV